MGTLLLIAAVILVVTALLWFLLSSGNRGDLAKMPGPKPLPILGNTLQFETNAVAFYAQILDFCKTYGTNSPVFLFMLGMTPMVVFTKAESAEWLLSSNKHITKSRVYHFIRPWLSTGLLTSTGEKWRNRRKLLTPTFHFRILADFLNVFNEQSSVMVNRLREKSGNKEFDIFSYITLCALDIISETAMGKKINAQGTDGNTDYVSAIYGISELIQERQKCPWLWPDFIYSNLNSGKKFNSYLKILHQFTRQVIQDREKELKESPEEFDFNTAEDDVGRSHKKRRLAFLDLLLNMSKDAGFTHDDIQEEVDTFMFEGHDTTAAAANWVVHLVGSHPDVQQKLHAEMDEIFGESDRPVTTDDIRKMKYLETVIKESLRLFPSVPIFARELEEDANICGYNVPKGAQMTLVTSALHRDATVFPDPEKFDPERFSPENATGRHPYAYVPFSAGPRNCIGQKFAMNEEKVILSAIFRNFSIESCQRRADLRPLGELILRPEHGIRVKLTDRK